MNFRFSLFMGYRYWRTRKANAFASFITFFAVSGIFLGVAALIIVSSVMNGLEGQLKQRILGAVPQLTLINDAGFSDWQTQAKSLTTLPQVQGLAPTVTTQAMVQSSKNISAVQVYGVFPEYEQNLSAIVANTYSSAFEQLTPGSYNVVLGSDLARKLSINVGDKIRILSGDGVVYSPLGPVPSQRKFTVAGLFEMGSQVDGVLAYVHYQDARRLMRVSPSEINELRVYLTDPFIAPEMGVTLTDKLAQQGIAIETRDWRDDFGHLFAAVKMEKNMMSLMLSLIVAVAAFNIVSALVMMVIDKTTDVAVLKTQGLTTQSVMNIFIVQGSLNAIIGLALGTLAGVTITLNLNSMLNVLGISVLGVGQNLPVIIASQQIMVIVVGTLIMTLLATIYPALTAARVQPATALRYE
ncbi:lipoprotein-releasing ABC transporter permease subunit [Pseudomonadota bacterium]|uniref:lipoprotein-releasing ABC transporter permease subunit n=1 Tax=unclassified Shewanella TaxID=196818 RepID=UPI000C845C6C|nr:MULTISPECIES: lipoprotein-releasing ABC transporter permease subunit [unclassified Shewanella]MDO6641685.1 lipoprotein-releasing ABC transporter permease subunit [Shewanella sp. 5_MG-2023]MDO6677932.1 lipoprotein-releasing ABC transporter permease subunit [Shewanella sp. 4_MG-2023]MDO6777052.1 lipoprotein-releasing ABC transporter permease subunit [Shewanella sp. 3_MG-2023]PMI01962.1 ABC transporter substrate-binding protein [Shewanella sp. 10N.286.48.A6]